ncbi:MAG: hypothetical protein R3C71_10075 [Candidatus Krumholzibacteriia bacterium]
MKKVLLVVLGLLLVLVLASPLLLKALFPEPKLRALLLPRAEAALGRTVDCAHLGIAFGLRGVSVELEQLELGADSTGYGLRELDLPLLKARLAWGPLLHREVAVSTLTFVDPSAELLLPPAGTPRAEAEGQEAASTAAVALAAPDVRLENARIHLLQEGGADLRCAIGGGRFASTVKSGETLQLSLKGTLEDVGLEATLPEGRTLSGNATLALDLQLVGEALNLGELDLKLASLRLAGGADAPQIDMGGLELTGSLSGALPALQASPPDLSALVMHATAEIADLTLRTPGDAPMTFTVPALQLPLALEPGAGVVTSSATLSGARLSGRTATGRDFSTGLAASLDARFDGRAQRLDAPRLEARLTDLALTGGTAKGDAPAPPDLHLASGAFTGTAGAPLAALMAKPLQLDAPGLEVKGRVEATTLRLTRPAPELLDLELPTLQGPVALGASTGGTIALDGLQLAPGTLKSASAKGARLEGTTPAGTLDLALVPSPEALTIPRLSAELQAMAFTSTPPTGKPVTMKLEGARLSGSAILPADSSRAPSAQLQLSARPATVEGATLAKPLKIEALELDGGLEHLTLKSMRASAGSSDLRANGSVDGLLGTPRVALTLRSGVLDLADFVVPAQKGAKPAAGAAPAAAPVLIPPLPGRVDFTVQRFVSPQATVESLSGQMTADPAGLKLEALKGNLMGGSFDGGFTMTPRADGDFDCKGDFDVTRVQAPAFLQAFTPVDRGVDGNLSTKTGFTFTLSQALKPRGLALDAAVDLANGALVDLPLLKNLAHLAGLPAKDRYGIGELKHAFQVRDDRVLARDLRLPFEDGWIQATGSAGLDGGLDFAGKWTLGPSTVSRLGSGSVLAFLKNAKGEVVLDFNVKGTTKSPTVTLDTKALEQQLAAEARQQLQEQGSDLINKGLDALKNLKKKP